MSISGAFAAQIAGKIYHRLYEENYFADRAPQSPTLPPIATVFGSGN
jgi:hypothetical protein